MGREAPAPEPHGRPPAQPPPSRAHSRTACRNCPGVRRPRPGSPAPWRAPPWSGPAGRGCGRSRWSAPPSPARSGLGSGGGRAWRPAPYRCARPRSPGCAGSIACGQGRPHSAPGRRQGFAHVRGRALPPPGLPRHRATAGPVPITATVTLTAAVVATTAATTILLGGGRVGLQLKRAGPSGQRQGDKASCTATRLCEMWCG